jgi:hypothetical protein
MDKEDTGDPEFSVIMSDIFMQDEMMETGVAGAGGFLLK